MTHCWSTLPRTLTGNCGATSAARLKRNASTAGNSAARACAPAQWIFYPITTTAKSRQVAQQLPSSARMFVCERT